MSKFKIGDQVRIVDSADRTATGGMHKLGDIGVIVKQPFSFGGSINWKNGVLVRGKIGRYDDHELELVKTGGTAVREPKKHLYRLRKDTLEYTAGTVVKEQCTDGTQDFNVLDKAGDETSESIKRELVVDNPEWFEQVRVVYEVVKKRGRKTVAKKTSGQSAAWTPERRAAQSKRMKKIRKQRGSNWGTK